MTNSVPLVQGFEISVPYARGSGTTWEGVGVAPNIASPGAVALQNALRRLGVEPVNRDINTLSQARLFTPRSTASPGGEAAVRRMIQELQSGEPNYGLLNEVPAKALRERSGNLHEMLTRLGAVESVRFVEINWVYGDIYDVKFADGSVYWAIALDSKGKIVMWEVRPVPAPETPPKDSR